MNEDKIASASDLFGNYRLIKQGGKPLNERATLLKYFHERAKDRYGLPFDISYIGMLLAHLKDVRDLYYLKSICEDSVRRGGVWNKTFFGSI